jgi:hypothetical protein
MKICSKCGVEKPEMEFYIRPDRQNDARTSHCRVCLSEYKKHWEKLNLDKKRATNKAWKKANPENIRRSGRTYRAANRGAVNARIRSWAAKQPGGAAGVASRWVKAHPEKRAAYSAKWYKENFAHCASIGKKWKKENKAKVNATAAARRATKFLASPAWANQFFIDEIYDLAQLRTKLTGIEWHVDHIVPLRSKLVSGLHVEQNLRVIPGQINIAKGNRSWPDMPGAL